MTVEKQCYLISLEVIIYGKDNYSFFVENQLKQSSSSDIIVIV